MPFINSKVTVKISAEKKEVIKAKMAEAAKLMEDKPRRRNPK